MTSKKHSTDRNSIIESDACFLLWPPPLRQNGGRQVGLFCHDNCSTSLPEKTSEHMVRAKTIFRDFKCPNLESCGSQGGDPGFTPFYGIPHNQPINHGGLWRTPTLGARSATGKLWCESIDPSPGPVTSMRALSGTPRQIGGFPGCRLPYDKWADSWVPSALRQMCGVLGADCLTTNLRIPGHHLPYDKWADFL